MPILLLAWMDLFASAANIVISAFSIFSWVLWLGFCQKGEGNTKKWLPPRLCSKDESTTGRQLTLCRAEIMLHQLLVERTCLANAVRESCHWAG